MSKKNVELFSWYGVAAILSAYALLNFHVLSVNSLSYQLLNITGGLGILIDAWASRNYQPVVLNVVWIVIALIAMVRILV